MERLKQGISAACTSLVAALIAACTALLAVRAMGFACDAPIVYALALAASALTFLGRDSGLRVVISIVLLLGGMAALVLTQGRLLLEAIQALQELPAKDVLLAHPGAGKAAALLLAYLLGLLFVLAIRARGGSGLVLTVLVATTVCAFAINEEIKLTSALPGLIGGVAILALPTDARREGVRTAVLPAAIVIATLALLFTPSSRVTWEPMEQLAERIRDIVDNYVHFTQERVAFSIDEQGYNRAGLVNDRAVAMLGGPANPSNAPVMRVRTDKPLLLRGSIKNKYTLYSWVDERAKPRYLYYDFTHRRARIAAFDIDRTDGLEGFETRGGQIELLRKGTSTLFVPSQLESFDMKLENAVYYNSAGEIFLTRDVEVGDNYAVSGRVAVDKQALVAAARAREDARDERMEEMLSEYTALPQGIEQGVYALAMELTQNETNAAQKAYAIENWLKQNCAYTLDGGIPERGRDFVSWFVLDERAGYCSYFASAMTVMCRIAGMPARYVEGYYVPANPSGETTVTGHNAHAWTEVYINGLGWIAFDPTAQSLDGLGAGDDSQGDSIEESGSEDENGEAAEDASGEDDASGEEDAPPEEDGDADLGSDIDDDESGDLDQSPPNENQDENQDEGSNDEPQSNEDDAPNENDAPNQNDPSSAKNNEDNTSDSSLLWLWILLACLLTALLIYLLVRILKRKLIDSDPLQRSLNEEDTQQAAAILYRALLTLLSAQGLAPMNGETPELFAQRISQGEDYEQFVRGTVRSIYAGRDVDEDTLKRGRSAYNKMLQGLKKPERMRFRLRCALRGIGNTQIIP